MVTDNLNTLLRRTILELSTARAENNKPDRDLVVKLEQVIQQYRDDYDAEDRVKIKQSIDELKTFRNKLKK